MGVLWRGFAPWFYFTVVGSGRRVSRSSTLILQPLLLNAAVQIVSRKIFLTCETAKLLLFYRKFEPTDIQRKDHTESLDFANAFRRASVMELVRRTNAVLHYCWCIESRYPKTLVLTTLVQIRKAEAPRRSITRLCHSKLGEDDYNNCRVICEQVALSCQQPTVLSRQEQC